MARDFDIIENVSVECMEYINLNCSKADNGKVFRDKILEYRFDGDVGDETYINLVIQYGEVEEGYYTDIHISFDSVSDALKILNWINNDNEKQSKEIKKDISKKYKDNRPESMEHYGY